MIDETEFLRHTIVGLKSAMRELSNKMVTDSERKECIINKEKVIQLEKTIDIMNDSLNYKNSTIRNKNGIITNLNDIVHDLKQQKDTHQLNTEDINKEYVYSNVHNHLNYNDDDEQFKGFAEDFVCKNPTKSINDARKPSIKIDDNAQYGPYTKAETKRLYEFCKCDMDIWTLYLNNHGVKCDKMGASNFVRRNRVCNFDTTDIYETERLYILIKKYETVENITTYVKGCQSSIKEYINILKPVDKFINSPDYYNLKMAEEFYNDLNVLRNSNKAYNVKDLAEIMGVKKDSMRRALDLMPIIKDTHLTFDDF